MSIYAAVARWRVQILVGFLVVAVVLATGLETRVIDGPFFLLGIVFSMGPIFLGIAAMLNYRPATMLQKPGSPDLMSVPNPGMVLFAGGYTVLGANLIADGVGDLFRGEWWPGQATQFLWVALLAYWWYLALGPFGVRLTPEGILQRNPLGSQFVPWDAVTGARPGRQNRVYFNVTDPARVIRRGIGPRFLAPQSDAAYVASLINTRTANRV
ncbi:PH domain-containing protein [Actinoplanes bogorensis]|uniref:PH domain-containing protein n=1 Tax=Paractinoplanes bogorensis TaxID=1610840 RepID=A0ABS5YPI2_9ACTN|nr:PH domain-containing protein [Actinoplanes bogorensis]MBU2665288.1 PH domain-containing protein [Actinoplanes bogorensis]